MKQEATIDLAASETFIESYDTVFEVVSKACETAKDNSDSVVNS